MEQEFETYKDSIFQGKLRNIILPIVFLVISIVLFVISPNFKSTEQVQNYMVINNQKLEYETFFIYIGLVFLLCTLLYIGVLYIKSSKRKFLLYENRIETTYRNKKETSISFNEITSIYKFRTFTRKKHAPYGILDCIAYKKGDSDFLVIKPDLSLKLHKNKGIDLINKINTRFTRDNLDTTVKNIHNKKIVKFDYLNSKLNQKVDALDKALYSLCYKPLNKKAVELYKKTIKHFLIVEKDGIIFNDEKIEFNKDDTFEIKQHDLNDLKDLDSSSVGKLFFIKDNENNIKFELDLIGLVNSDFFIELVSKIYDIKKGNSNIPTDDIQQEIEIVAPEQLSEEQVQFLDETPEEDQVNEHIEEQIVEQLEEQVEDQVEAPKEEQIEQPEISPSIQAETVDTENNN